MYFTLIPEKAEIKRFLQDLTKITVSVRIFNVNEKTDLIHLLSGIFLEDWEPVIAVLCEVPLVEKLVEKVSGFFLIY